MGSSPWVYVSFLLQASTGATRRDNADGGTRKVLAECRLGPWPPVLFCFVYLEGQGLILSFPVLTTGLISVFSERLE